MNREVHVRFCEGLGVQFPGPTRQCDGVTDDTTAINNTIATAASSTNASSPGGTIMFPASTCLMLGAMDIPYHGGASSTLPYQKPLRLTGTESSANGYWTVIALPSGGSVLDMRYAGGDGTHVAKIDTRGAGRLEIDHLTIKDGGTDNYPFIQTTNTTVFIHDNAFSGNPS